MLGFQLPNIIRGKIVLACSGPIPTLLNQAYQAGIRVDNIYWVDEHTVHLTIYLPDFFKFAKLVRPLPIKVKIVKKRGLPFMMKHVWKRKSLYFGVILFFLLLLTMTSFVWKVQVSGIERIPEAHVRSILGKEGIYEGQLKSRLPDRKGVQQRLLDQLPQASWVGLRTEGTRVIIIVVEKKVMEPNVNPFPTLGPVHLIARKDALVTDVQVHQGNPIVEVNEMVKKGQLLVSGIYGDPSQPNVGKIVGSRGKVMGEVWYESEVSVSLDQKRKVYTRLREQRSLPYIGNWILRNPFHSDKPYSHYETIQIKQPIQFRKWNLPIGLVQEEILEMKWINQRIALPEAIKLAKDLSKEELFQWIGSDGKIVEEKVLHQRLENGKVYLKVHFDAIENIAIPQPILQGE